MLFNSIEFALFLPIVFALYWFVTAKKLRLQNILLLGASYVFYGWWDWRFLSLIIASSLMDYFLGHKMVVHPEKSLKRKLLLFTSLAFNLGLLGFFKYYNFFAESFADAFTLFGQGFEASRLSIILPVGISFYTFQTLSYSIDIYRGKLKPTRDVVGFFAYVSFFPQLVAGPIERATNLLPQFAKQREFKYDKAVDGLRQILWGLFKKMVIADNCAIYVNQIFDTPGDFSGSTLLLGAVLFAFQIYGDFSGYSDIAIGTARLFGFNLMQNFAFPYFSRDIAEFWRRWHISLSTWFRDYLYIPLGGSRGGTMMKVRNTFVIFLVSGFWHGANWTFIIWGLLNAIYFLPLLLAKINRVNTDTIAENKFFPNLREVLQVGFTFLLTCLAWVFFRADSLKDAWSYLDGIFSSSLLSFPELLTPKIEMVYLFISIPLFLFMEWIYRNEQYGFAIHNLSKNKRWFLYIVVFLWIITFGYFGEQEFIYFQF